MPRIFISYRQADTRAIVGRIYDQLIQAFGEKRVFKDLYSIPLGEDFRTTMLEAVRSCDVLVVAIGKNWLEVRDAHGNRRLDAADDYVRLEIETGLARKIPVIPILVEGATMPRPEELPESLRPLAYRKAINVRPDPDFPDDIAKLVKRLKGITAPRYKAALWSLISGSSAAMGILAILFVVQRGKDALPTNTTNVVSEIPFRQATDSNVSVASVPNSTALITNDSIVWDPASKLAWAQDIFQLGLTRDLFKSSNEAADIEALASKISLLSLGNTRGWRIANSNDVDTLAKNNGRAVFEAFQHHRIEGGALNLIGIYSNRDKLAVFGYQYANFLRGPFFEHGGYGYNEYGVWVVNGPLQTSPVEEAFEKRTTVILIPFYGGTLTNGTNGGVIIEEGRNVRTAVVLKQRDAESRAEFSYDLGSITEKGAFVEAEIFFNKSGPNCPLLDLLLYPSTEPLHWEPKLEERDFIKLERINFLPQRVHDVGIWGNWFRSNGRIRVQIRCQGEGRCDLTSPQLKITYIKRSDLMIPR